MNVTCNSDEVTISEEHEDFGWFSYEEIEELISKDLLTRPAVEAFTDIK